MRAGATRWLQRGLLLVAAAVVVAVLASVRQPAPPAAPPGPATAPAPGATPVTQMGGLVYRYLKGGRESFVVRASHTTGTEQEGLRLSNVDVEFSYTADGQPAKGRIRADACFYQPTEQLARFSGNVVLETADGLELTGETLDYDAKQGRASSDDLVRFRRKDTSGSSKGAAFRAEQGALELRSEVFVRIEDEVNGPTEIHAGTGSADRTANELRFDGGVDLVRGEDRLRAKHLLLTGTLEEIDRLRAIGAVQLDTQGDPRLAAGGAQQGPRQLRCEQLDVNLRQDRSLDQATASGEAELVARPAPGQRPEQATLRASVLTFWWDEAGHLISLMGQKGASLMIDAPGGQAVRRVEARNITSRMAPESGAVRDAEFRGDVVFTQGERKATGGRASYDGPSSALTLFEDPQLVDSARGSQLRAVQIEIQTQSGAISGSHNVQHTIKGSGSGPLLGGQGGILLASRYFHYDPASRTARYSEAALLRSGASEVRGAEIQLQEAATGERRLEATGGVLAKIVSEAKPGATAGTQGSEAQCESLVYDEARRRLTYKGNVRLVQGEVEVRGPEADVSLSPDGANVERLEAGAPVEVRQGARRVTGDRMTYTPADGAVNVVGEKVELVEGTQRVQGRSLIFFTADDRIVVDGREEARTETVLRRNPQNP